ncbi:DDE-type integrase/transposase/recombinase [Micromonospora sp. NPDC050397]|uniref:DDE-type integrase/transposase/recombinase n=1 Tax=Micromonospora sp. NPDC050397 TaxID=3364279 RepID=UPI00384CEC3A
MPRRRQLRHRRRHRHRPVHLRLRHEPALDPHRVVGHQPTKMYRAVDQHGHVSDLLVAGRRDAAVARRFFRRALGVLTVTPMEVVTKAAPVRPAVLDHLIPSACHQVKWHANKTIEADPGPAARISRPDNATDPLCVRF